jgi:ADP-ribosylation factor-like protein 2
MSLEEIAETLQLRDERISGRHWTIMTCSAMTGEGLVQGIDWLVSDISSRIFLMA